jgi:hypothetical protein
MLSCLKTLKAEVREVLSNYFHVHGSEFKYTYREKHHFVVFNQYLETRLVFDDALWAVIPAPVVRPGQG